MKNKWLNLVLVLSNHIYSQKQLIVEQAGLAAISNIIGLIFWEILLGVISLPLYLTMKSDKVVAYFAEKENYAKINFDYNLRRILTVTGVGAVAVIYAFKLLLILVFPVAYGPLQLYSVSNFRPIDISNRDLINTETSIQTARIVPSMPRPELEMVQKIKGGDYVFTGGGQPGATVVLFLSDQSTIVYTSEIDKNGHWQIVHQQSGFKLSEGNHSVVVFNYDKKMGVRSETAPEQYFKTTTSWSDYFLKNIDSVINWLVVIIIFIGAFLILLTI